VGFSSGGGKEIVRGVGKNFGSQVNGQNSGKRRTDTKKVLKTSQKLRGHEEISHKDKVRRGVLLDRTHPEGPLAALDLP